MAEKDAYWQGRIDGLKEAIAELKRGPWWHLRDLIARGLRWLALRVEPHEPR